ncbi:MAG: hypothetical protein JSW05_02540 [Candidatus Thorarchaeota archaeon]|nr:MAG: hypothetical protein JSW05_02540 [Candidatus Thorarchaeota archaeon]
MIVIEMACTTEQQSIQPIDVLESIKCEEPSLSDRARVADEESRVLRTHLAQEEALRQFERRKSLALAESHRMSFNR